MKYYDEIVKNRNSCRKFSDKKVSDDAITKILEYYNDEESRLIDEIETELHFCFDTVYETLNRGVGYNGICIKAPAYMLLFSEEADHFLENAGYIAQGITLKMTELGLAACWMTIDDAETAKATFKIKTDKTLACVVAFGYRDPKNKEKAAPKISFSELCYGSVWGEELNEITLSHELEDCLRACAHAQSFMNLQPYRMLVDYSEVDLVGLPSESTNEYDTGLNYGIVMFNFYAVMWAVRPSAPRWTFEAPGRELKLPSDVTYIAKCRL